MIRYLDWLVGRFLRNESGAFLVLFGILAIVLVATAGAVVDFSRIEQARTRAQIALDAAVLGLQPRIFDTSPVRSEQYFIDVAQPLVMERMGLDNDDDPVTVAVTDATIDARDGMLRLDATIVVPTFFVALVGIESVRARVSSEATRKRLNLEVAMVLDNSGSMASYSRMVKLKEAAKSAADILFDDQDTQPNVFVSVVPFTQFVNVGKAKRTASWMSQTGASSVSHYNFDTDDNEDTPFTSTVNRWALYDGFVSKSWAGCVEARIKPYDVQDAIPNPTVPDTMFQPVFAPDSPVDNYLIDDPAACHARGSCTWVQTRTGCNNGGSTCTGTTTTNATYTNKTGLITTSTRLNNNATPKDVCTCETPLPADSNRQCSTATSCSATKTDTTTQTGSGNNRTRVQTKKCFFRWDPTASYGNLSAVELQQRLCKYTGATYSEPGPNSDCPITSVLPLTNVRATVKARIDAMVASGSTNIEQGAIWGFHSLSSSEPLTEARGYEEATHKVMIVMTDGENNPNYDTYTNTIYGVTSWMAWGYRSDKRLLTESTTPKDSVATAAQVIAEIDKRTVQACANAKAAGIIVYSIGLSAPNNTTKQMLKDCANANTTVNGATTVYSYFPNDSSELVAVFETIASQLSELRIAK